MRSAPGGRAQRIAICRDGVRHETEANSVVFLNDASIKEVLHQHFALGVK